MGISLQDAGLIISQPAIPEGEVSGYFNIVPLPSPCRRTLNSEQRHRGTLCLRPATTTEPVTLQVNKLLADDQQPDSQTIVRSI